MLKCVINVEAFVAGLNVAYSAEIVEVNTGKDWYYDLLHDAIHYIVQDPISKSYRSVPYAHAPEVPEGYRSRTEYVPQGKAFEPQEFWQKSMDEQLVELKDPIMKCNLLPIVDKQYDALVLYAISYSVAPSGKPYPIELELQFEKAVWQVLHNKYGVSCEDFTKSIRSMLIPEDRLYSAPLIVYFSDKLAPRYEFHYKDANKLFSDLTKVVKLPSEFEVLTGTPDTGKVVYEAK